MHRVICDVWRRFRFKPSDLKLTQNDSAPNKSQIIITKRCVMLKRTESQLVTFSLYFLPSFLLLYWKVATCRSSFLQPSCQLKLLNEKRLSQHVRNQISGVRCDESLGLWQSRAFNGSFKHETHLITRSSSSFFILLFCWVFISHPFDWRWNNTAQVI